jgi:hypothetical protein
MKIIINENQSFVLRRLSYVDEIMTTKFELIYHKNVIKKGCKDYYDEYEFFNVVFEYVFEMFYHKYLSNFNEDYNPKIELLESYYDIIHTYLDEEYGTLIRDKYSDNCP